MKYSAKIKGESNKGCQSKVRSYETPKKASQITEETTVKKDKREQLQAKKLQKFRQSISICCSFILRSDIEKAIQSLRSIITQAEYLTEYQFTGVGNIQNWKGQYKTPQSWLSDYLSPGNQEGKNPFDLLSICFMVQLTSGKVIIETIMNEYFQIAKELRSCDGKYEIQVGLGNVYYNNLQIRLAQEQYLFALEQKQSDKIYQYLALINGRWFHRHEIQSQFWQKCLENNSSNLRAQIHFAILKQQESQCFKQLKSLAENHPNNSEIWLAFANKTEDQQEAKQYCNKAINNNPQLIEAYICSASKHFISNPERAGKILTDALMIESQAAEIYYYLGQLEHSLGNFQLQGEYYDKAVEVNPLYFPALKSLAEILVEQQEIERARQLYEQYIKLNPHDESVYLQLGNIQWENENDDEAIELFKKALEENPESIETVLRLAEIYESLQDHEEALDYYFKAHMMNFDNPNPCFGIAKAYYSLHKMEQAKEWAQTCIEKGGDAEHQIYYLIGDIQFDNKDVYAALEWYLQRTCVTKKLNTDFIMDNLVDMFDRDQTVEMLETICFNAPQTADSIILILQIAKLFIELDKPGHAARCYEGIRAFVSQTQLPEEFKEQFRNVYGDHDNGFFTFEDKKKIEDLKIKYSLAFKRLYEKNMFI